MAGEEEEQECGQGQPETEEVSEEAKSHLQSAQEQDWAEGGIINIQDPEEAI